MGGKVTLPVSLWHIFLIGSLAVLPACDNSDKIGQIVNDTAETKKMTAEQDAISALEFLTGRWAGPGTSYDRDGTETAYYDTEFVRFDLEQSLLLINAQGKRPNGTTTYSLHTIIHYDKATMSYIYTPYSREGGPGFFRCKLNDTPQLICLTQDKSYRLTFQRLSDGRWNEFGERLNDEGQWMKNFETILSGQRD